MRRWLARRERLGLTLRELSVETGVPAGTLGHWAWKLRREGAAGETSGGSARFVALVASGAEASAADGRIEIVLPGDRRVIVSGAVDEATLARVMKAVQRC